MKGRRRIAVVLAAGKGTRMRSSLPKVLHEAAGRPLLHWVLDGAREAGCERIVVVVGHGADAVREATPGEDLEWVVQGRQLGTGHALARAESVVPEEALLLVLSGDVPLVRPSTLEALIEASGPGGAMAVAEVEEPGSLGRVVGDGEGRLVRIVEAADALPADMAIRRINAGVYALPAPEVFADLRSLETDNVQGELYLTDAVTAAAADGRPVRLVDLDDPSEALGVNTRRELALVDRLLVGRVLDELMDSGVTMVDPARIRVEATIEIGADAVLHPGVSLLGETRIGSGAEIHQGCWIRSSAVGEGAEILPYSVVDSAVVGAGARVGPFARLRPGAELGEGARVGNFVEVKNARLGAGAKASHLAYLGDAEIGDDANVGAGVVTCNYDGTTKHRTEIGDGAFVGSDTMLVAPVRVGRRATTAAGSVITRDVPDGALGVGRARQRNVPGWDERHRGDGGEEE